MQAKDDNDFAPPDRLTIDYESGREKLWLGSGCLWVLVGVPWAAILPPPNYREFAVVVVLGLAFLSFRRRMSIDDRYEIDFSERCIHRLHMDAGGERRTVLWRADELEAVALCAARNPSRGSSDDDSPMVPSAPATLYGLQLVTRAGRIWTLSPPLSPDREKQERLGALLAERLGLSYENSHPERRLKIRRLPTGKLELTRESATVRTLHRAIQLLALCAAVAGLYVAWCLRQL